MGTLTEIREQIRQQTADDADFYQKYLYFFELKTPAEVSTTGGWLNYLFPLIIPPKSYSISEPFTVEVTPTQGGGLYVEENGIVQRTIRLQGSTGFKPRPLPLRLGAAKSANLDPSQKSFSRDLPETVLDKISGQRHFQYLQDSIFRTYGDLKRDPATAKDTQLIFHVPKDRESWVVVPQSFDLSRDSGSPFTYNYTIDLLVVDKADQLHMSYSEDKNVFDTIKDVLYTMKKGVNLVSGAIQDLTALVGEIKTVVSTAVDIIDAAGDIMDSVTDFVNGVSDLVESPLALVESTIEACESAQAALGAFNDLAETAKQMPSMIAEKFATMQDGLELFLLYPDVFSLSLTQIIANQLGLEDPLASLSTTEQAATSSPTTLGGVRNLGTSMTAGDVESAKGLSMLQQVFDEYKNGREITVMEGDTLSGLAAKYLGDARKWKYIAVVNGLKPPYVNEQANAPLSGGISGQAENPFSHAVGVGKKIIIPTNQASPKDSRIFPIAGAKPSDSTEIQYLGVDLALESNTNADGKSFELYDIPITVDDGGQDFQVKKGLENLKQMVLIRIMTEQGTDSLYKRLGLQRVVALSFTPVDFAMTRFRVVDTLSKDARISSVKLNKFEQDMDQLQVDLDVNIRGLGEAQPVSIIA